MFLFEDGRSLQFIMLLLPSLDMQVMKGLELLEFNRVYPLEEDVSDEVRNGDRSDIGYNCCPNDYAWVRSDSLVVVNG